MHIYVYIYTNLLLIFLDKEALECIHCKSTETLLFEHRIVKSPIQPVANQSFLVR